MNSYGLSHLADHILLRELTALVSQDRATTAALLARLAEVDERKLYLPAAYSSMYDYCVRELRMSEDAAFRRIGVARTSRQFPAIFVALADGRLNMTGVLLLTPRLTPETADDLLAAAAHKTKDEIRLLLAERFPKPDVPTIVRAIAPATTNEETVLRPLHEPAIQLALERVVPSDEPIPTAAMEPLPSRAELSPLSPGRFALQLTVNQDTHDLLRRAQALLGHALPSGDIAAVIERALRELVQKLELRKFAKSSRLRPRRSDGEGRYVPADIRRTVWQRDGGQCTYVSESGKRCEARTRLEYDHVDPVARGGETTVANTRLRCRSHNQFTAEQTFGMEFMRGKRQEARRKAAEAKAKAQATARAEARARAEESARAKAEAKTQALAEVAAAAEAARERDVIPWLRQLGFNAAEARRGAANCAHIPDAPLEERVRIAVRGLAPRCVHKAAHVTSNTP